jgi:hypothetical protein
VLLFVGSRRAGISEIAAQTGLPIATIEEVFSVFQRFGLAKMAHDVFAFDFGGLVADIKLPFEMDCETSADQDNSYAISAGIVKYLKGRNGDRMPGIVKYLRAAFPLEVREDAVKKRIDALARRGILQCDQTGWVSYEREE